MEDVQSTRFNTNSYEGFAAIQDVFHYWALALPSYIRPTTPNIPRIISVGGGKGGVGKSLISANLASKLAKHKKRVLLVDLDIGSSNLHTYLSVGSIKYHLSDYLKNKVSFSSVLSPTLSPNIAFIPGDKDSDILKLINTNPEVSTNFWTNLFNTKQNYGVDFIILDLGAGNLQCICDFFSLCHLGILTVIPEPSSIENAYSFLKTYIWSFSVNVLEKLGQFQLSRKVQEQLPGFAPCKSYSYLDYLEDLVGEELTNYIRSSLNTRLVAPLINETRYSDDGKISEVMSYTIRHYFGLQSQSIGQIPYDEITWKSMRKKGLLVKDFPYSQFSKNLDQVASNICNFFGYR